MTELSDALARSEDYPGLSAAELAAAKADGHLSMCREPYFADCDQCPMLLAQIQRLVRLVRPVIEGEVREQEREYYEEELRGQRIVAYNEGVLAGRASVEKPNSDRNLLGIWGGTTWRDRWENAEGAA